MAEYKDELLDHDYDGIQELDNDLPRWWLYLFYITIVFSVFYWLYYHTLEIGYSQADAYEKEMDPNFFRAQDNDPSYAGLLPKYRSPYAKTLAERRMVADVAPKRYIPTNRENDTTTYVMVEDAGLLAAGKEIYIKNCASCHGNLGEGGVGPNLTDNYWIHGGDFPNVVKTVRYGFPTKGMIPWLGTLQPDQIIHTSSYVMTLKGTNPPNAKAPEGEPEVEQPGI